MKLLCRQSFAKDKKEGCMKMDPILGEGIPISIKTKRQWIKTNEKVPIESGWNLSENWKTFDDIKGCSYPGFCLTENYVCFDFDHTIDENGNLGVFQKQAF